MSVFAYDDYKKIIRDRTQELKKRHGQRYTLEKVAHACGVQKTYLSKVLNSDTNLSADQLFAACQFLLLTADEIDFSLLLRERTASVHQQRKELISGRIQDVRATQLNTERHLQSNAFQPSAIATWEYYSDANLQLVHLFLSIPRFTEDTSQIEQSLGLSAEELSRCLDKLRSLNLVSLENGKWSAPPVNIHLSENSPAFRQHRVQQRLKTIERMNNRCDGNPCHFSALFTADQSTFISFRRHWLDFLKKIQKEAVAAPSEDVYQMNFDLFSWS
jgi:uncharacterized protein (TIGR02147 family)